MRTRIKHTKKRLGSESGQAMVEAAIGLAMLVFTWAAMFYYSSITSAGIRSAVAARHAAWSAGNGAATDAATLKSDIYYTGIAVALDQAEGETDASGVLSSGNAIIGAIMSIFPDNHTADVTSTPESGQRIHNLTSVSFPVVNESLELTSVSAHCEWDSVDANWDSMGDILSDALGAFGDLF